MEEGDATNTETRGGRWAIALGAGVLLPAVAVAVEGEGAWLGSIVASPIPTGWHVALLVVVIASNLIGLLATPRLAAHRLVGALNGVTLGVAGIYTLMFLPLMPLALIACIIYGLGLLGFAPLGTFLCALWVRARLKRMLQRAALDARPVPSRSYRAHPDPEPIVVDPRVRGTALGVVVGVAVLLLLELGPALTHRDLRAAASADPTIAAGAVERLRSWGDDDVMSAAGHGRRHRGGLSVLLGDGRVLTPQQARAVYYQVHGRRCPASDSGGRGATLFRGGAIDEDQGSDRIGDTAETLSLVTSRLDGSIDGDAALGYVEWTLAWRNDHASRDAEARALVALPPGGVVSRATLWIDGEEREAAFGGRGDVKRAYRRVVRRQRDPLLVTSAGPDRVLMQCFPIAPDGGVMKIRVGITFPLDALDAQRASAPMPRLIARNFEIAGGADARALWIESDDALSFEGDAIAPDGDGLYRFRKDGAHPDVAYEIVALREDPAARAVAPDPLSPSASSPHGSTEGAAAEMQIEQWLEPVAITPPSRLVVALDTSAMMAPYATAVTEALAAIVDGQEAALVLAADTPRDVEVVAPAPMSASLRQGWRSRLEDVDWAGGRDNVPALGRAWDLAAERQGAVVLWIHAAQPVVLSSAEPLRQRWDRQPDGPAIVHLQAGQGEDVTIAELFDAQKLRAVPRRGGVKDDLARHIGGWRSGAVAHERRLRRTEQGRAAGDATPARTSPHLARLWARSEVAALRARGDTERATELALRYQLVTPVSGAVVLESARQYDEAGLQPVDPQSVPTVPEPETWALLIVAAAMILVMARRHRWSPA